MLSVAKRYYLISYFEILRQSTTHLVGKQFFSHVETEPPIPGYYQYFWGVNVSCSRKQHAYLLCFGKQGGTESQHLLSNDERNKYGKTRNCSNQNPNPDGK